MKSVKAEMGRDPSMKDVYEKKLKQAEELTARLLDKDGTIVERSKVRDILHEVEKELRKTKEGSF